MQIDVNQCIYGLIGATGTDSSDCGWATYYINYPLMDMNFSNYTMQGMVMPSTCNETIPDYDTAGIVG